MSAFCNLVLLGLLIASVAALWQWRNAVDTTEFYKGKRVIVTGASKGIGRSLAIQLAKLGAKVVVAARSGDKLADVQKECRQYGAHVHTVVADVSKEEDCKAIVEKTVSEFGGIDILILNAAFSPAPSYFEDYEDPANYAADVLGSKGYIVPVSSGTGFFKSLNQEFIITNVPVSITIMPLPYVLTDKAIENWKPRDLSQGITAEDCADRMLTGIPQRRLFYYVDWPMLIVAHLYSLSPELFEYGIRVYLPFMSELF